MSYIHEKMKISKLQENPEKKMFFYQEELYTLFEELIHKPWGHHIWVPLIDVFENDDSYEIKVDLPGMDEENINVSTSDSRLLIKGRRAPNKNLENREILTNERPQGFFCREIEFHEKLNEKNIKKRYENGILTVVVKKQRD